MPGGNVLELQERSKVFLRHDAAACWGATSVRCSYALWGSLQAQEHTSVRRWRHKCPKTQENAQSFARCPWLAGSWGWGEWGSSPAKDPLQLPVLNLEKITPNTCSPFPNSSLGGLGETRVLAAYRGVVPPCWQEFSLHLKQEKWKAVEAQVPAASLVCAGRYLQSVEPPS